MCDRAMTKQKQGILGHWVLAMSVILIAAVLSIPQIDKYMLGLDATNSLQVSGWVADRAYSPIDVLHALYTSTPYQGPLYFLLLNQWGNLVGQEIALARMLSIYCALVSLAMAYRIGRDAISPVAGNFAVIILASSTFYGFFFAHVRPYAMLAMLATFVIWLYIRIAILERSKRRSDYVALSIACGALVGTHMFGLLLYIVFALYHLFFVRKRLRWLAVPVAAVAGLALSSPYILVTFAEGPGYFVLKGTVSPAQLSEVFLAAWLNMITNGAPFLLLLFAAGAALAWRQNCVSVRSSAKLFALLFLAVALVTVGLGGIWESSMRYMIAGLPIAVLFQAAGLYALYRKRKIFGALLLCLWVLAGLSFAGYDDWSQYIGGRTRSYSLPPWHLVSRTAEKSGDPAHVIAFMLSDSMMWSPWGSVGMREHWFDRRDIEFRWVGAVKWLEEYLRLYEGPGIAPWVVYQKSRIDEVILAELEATMDELGYRACRRVSLATTTEMVQYSWVSLDCMPAELSLSSQAGPLQYNFYGAKLAPAGSKLYFANKWTLRSQDALDRLKISHQLVDEDWENVVQLDRPLASADKLRQFAIDVSDVPPGRYRLMAIVYDPITGKTLDWQGAAGNPPSMLFLHEVEIR